jgi:hypothetical protein
MATPITLKKFQELHPFPEQVGIKSLYRFSKLTTDNLHHFQHLLIEQKLHQTPPDQLNDPFECKPDYILERTESEINQVRDHFVKIAMESRQSPQRIKEIIDQVSTDPSSAEKIIRDASIIGFKHLRICCFTTNKSNLLLWSHYADSHKGVCVEFDATKPPISLAFKVHYSNKYPKAIYPPPSNQRVFVPALTKSKEWEYEDEFRTIFREDIDNPKIDGKSLILNGDEILNVYLGAEIDTQLKEELLSIILKSSFSPKIWVSNLSESSFSLSFSEYIEE